VLTEMSSILNTGLDRETLSVCVSLCESGVNPEALAAVIKELRRESASTRVSNKHAHSWTGSFIHR
ncbi:mitotic-spindle organizing gamma-tubulin ring associated-domain-containing protein, partial [Linnemannia elongata]